MNRTALAIRMLMILKTRKFIKKAELAQMLETNPRNIIELKRELETAGYVIEVTNGPYGGYSLMDATLFPLASLNEQERRAMLVAAPFLLTSKEPLLSDEFKQAMEKILANEKISQPIAIATSAGWQLAMDKETLQQYLSMFSSAILSAKRVEMIYKPQNKASKAYLIEPRELIQVNGLWYVLCQDSQKGLATYKINRIEKMTISDRTYRLDEDFIAKKAITPYGHNVTKPIRCVLHIKNREYLSEYIFGENQKIDWISDDEYVLTVDLRGEHSIMQFVLQLGSDCVVIEPEELRMRVVAEVEKMSAIYLNNA
jgi:predicted DNA-binding transcriptional regulator YafY